MRGQANAQQHSAMQLTQLSRANSTGWPPEWCKRWRAPARLSRAARIGTSAEGRVCHMTSNSEEQAVGTWTHRVAPCLERHQSRRLIKKQHGRESDRKPDEALVEHEPERLDILQYAPNHCEPPVLQTLCGVHGAYVAVRETFALLSEARRHRVRRAARTQDSRSKSPTSVRNIAVQRLFTAT